MRQEQNKNKSEYQNPKYETISKFKLPNDQNVLNFGFLSFEFVSDLEFRASCLSDALTLVACRKLWVFWCVAKAQLFILTFLKEDYYV